VVILAIHNRYQIRGGEDASHEAKVQMLTAAGHTVQDLIFDNASIRNAPNAALQALWNTAAYDKIGALIASCRPDVLDVDNFFPLASPSIYYAASRHGIPIVQTLHNYRLICPGSTLFRNGAVCEDCVGSRIPWRGAAHGCYRQSIPASLAVTAMLTVHNLLATWEKRVSLFVALTEFCKQKFIQGGLPAGRIAVKPNFVQTDLGPGTGDANYALYAGRLTEEKGILSLLQAWKAVRGGTLVIVGDGPLAPDVKRAAEMHQSIKFLGSVSAGEARELMGRARVLVFPSIWYECLPMVIIESFCRGTPVIANRLGSMEYLIRDGETGWLLDPANPDSLAEALSNIFAVPERPASMRLAARTMFEANYTAKRNHQLLVEIYERAGLHPAEHNLHA
jgi:glycosyltransferase involved in cell wall biosynthesis